MSIKHIVLSGGGPVGLVSYGAIKQLVNDKVQSRAEGPKMNLTKQPASGKSRQGGMRVGEMERDGVIAHGCSYFLKESLMERGDKYKMAICNHTGTIAIYDSERKSFFSPLVDGPLTYDPEDNTGLAHYLEHMVFKGTDEIGTQNWQKEKCELK